MIIYIENYFKFDINYAGRMQHKYHVTNFSTEMSRFIIITIKLITLSHKVLLIP